MTTETVQKEQALIVPWVFHQNGRRLQDFAKSWRKARRLAGVPDRIFRDTRRTAVRTFQRAGVPTATAMEMSATARCVSTNGTRSAMKGCSGRAQ